MTTLQTMAMIVMMMKTNLNRAKAIVLPISLSILALTVTTPASASINCADTLPSSYFKRIDDKQKFAGKLGTLANGTQQLQDQTGSVVLDKLSNAYVLMNKYVWAQRQGKQGIVTATTSKNQC
ncbi:hypothetical protein [Psychrobacter urativorans]|uniref:Uncharacterized protein n=1 Tax=Psychrobacter urativorans TaxID=45610 RepID=A0A0M4T6A8_9GAMM|nr:hypothetical protein [Psychrobacter urativorans]ALF58934.1 hypothetical protein AOC03_01775 [Psychrobacter urativorans]